MKRSERLNPRSSLLARVQRHAAMATLFRPADQDRWRPLPIEPEALPATGFLSLSPLQPESEDSLPVVEEADFEPVSANIEQPVRKSSASQPNRRFERQQPIQSSTLIAPTQSKGALTDVSLPSMPNQSPLRTTDIQRSTTGEDPRQTELRRLMAMHEQKDLPTTQRQQSTGKAQLGVTQESTKESYLEVGTGLLSDRNRLDSTPAVQAGRVPDSQSGQNVQRSASERSQPLVQKGSVRPVASVGNPHRSAEQTDRGKQLPVQPARVVPASPTVQTGRVTVSGAPQNIQRKVSERSLPLIQKGKLLPVPVASAGNMRSGEVQAHRGEQFPGSFQPVEKGQLSFAHSTESSPEVQQPPDRAAVQVDHGKMTADSQAEQNQREWNNDKEEGSRPTAALPPTETHPKVDEATAEPYNERPSLQDAIRVQPAYYQQPTKLAADIEANALQRQGTSATVANEPVMPAETEARLRQTLERIPTRESSEMGVELILPRRPRPQPTQTQTGSDTQRNEQSVQRKSEESGPPERSLRAEDDFGSKTSATQQQNSESLSETTLEVEAGFTPPADLWHLLNLTAPQTASESAINKVLRPDVASGNRLDAVSNRINENPRAIAQVVQPFRENQAALGNEADEGTVDTELNRQEAWSKGERLSAESPDGRAATTSAVKQVVPTEKGRQPLLQTLSGNADLLQRESVEQGETDSTQRQSASNSTSATKERESQAKPIDVMALAQEVYAQLKQLLWIERERLGK